VSEQLVLQLISYEINSLPILRNSRQSYDMNGWWFIASSLCFEPRCLRILEYWFLIIILSTWSYCYLHNNKIRLITCTDPSVKVIPPPRYVRWIWRFREAELNWVITNILFIPLLKQLLIGISISLWHPPTGT
jgi:hypothetical protein